MTSHQRTLYFLTTFQYAILKTSQANCLCPRLTAGLKLAGARRWNVRMGVRMVTLRERVIETSHIIALACGVCPGFDSWIRVYRLMDGYGILRRRGLSDLSTGVRRSLCPRSFDLAHVVQSHDLLTVGGSHTQFPVAHRHAAHQHDIAFRHEYRYPHGTPLANCRAASRMFMFREMVTHENS